MKSKKQRKVDEIMDHFEFDKVETVMNCLNWTWKRAPNPPELWELKAHLRNLLDEIPEENKRNARYHTACGGFVVEAEWDKEGQIDYLDARFEVSQWSC